MPRRNNSARLRSQPRPPDLPAERADTDDLARELVDRGLSPHSILDRPARPPDLEGQPSEH